MAGKSGESVSISVPYRNLRKDVEVEMVTTKHGNENASSSSSSPLKDCSLVTLVLSCTVAAGVQFGWALQLSLLTPYIQVVTLWHFLSQ
ncbi:hypothetical protein F2Q68_00011756 [Brassica cretica]|uniref:Sucrose transporter n=1 Tax=Brassica cretica TaxID=69181 RepID=A0A8S9KQP2_BRACR|nr:hypothetical protein F2Q68_00011756 [Brassica cretica]